MADLEDRLLKKNIPGKYTWWEEEREDRGGGVDEIHLDDQDEEPIEIDYLNGPPPASSMSRRPTTGRAGPKGVLADKKLHDEMDKIDRDLRETEKQVMLERWTRGALMKPGEVSLSGTAIEERKRRAKQSERMQQEHDDGTDNDDDDDDFLMDYRKQRIEEWKRANQVVHVLQNYHCGQLQEVDPDGFADAIDETPANVAVVVHLYEQHVPDCQRLNRILEELSPVLPARFLKLQASAALPSMDPLGLPSLSIYRAGELVANLTPITQNLPKNFEIQHVRQLLEQCGLKRSSTASNSHNVVRHSVEATNSDCLDFDGDGNYDGVD
jgi:antitoxin (DNA-binding transcriptional repressor) of toxin-antitoxin stability system